VQPDRVPDPLELPLSSSGQVEPVLPAVDPVPPPLQKLVRLEVVDEPDDLAGRYLQLRRQRLLAQPGLQGDQAQYADLGRGEIELGDSIGEPRRGVRTELGKQERDAGWGLHSTSLP